MKRNKRLTQTVVKCSRKVGVVPFLREIGIDQDHRQLLSPTFAKAMQYLATEISGGFSIVIPNGPVIIRIAYEVKS